MSTLAECVACPENRLPDDEEASEWAEPLTTRPYAKIAMLEKISPDRAGWWRSTVCQGARQARPPASGRPDRRRCVVKHSRSPPGPTRSARRAEHGDAGRGQCLTP